MTLYQWLAVGLILGLSLSSCGERDSGNTHIAVATNFLRTAETLEVAFEVETDYRIDLVSGATGQLYTQIINGAPYDVFLSADTARVSLLINTGHADPTTRLTYASGQLVLCGTGDVQERLKSLDFKSLAMANPDLAPYGLAAKQTLRAMNVSVEADRIVYGQNIGQSYGFVITRNAEIGFAALSQTQDADNCWRVPDDFYEPIKQDGVLLNGSKNKASALAFLNYLKTDEARKIIKMSGYEVVKND